MTSSMPSHPGLRSLHPNFNEYAGRPYDQDTPSNIASHQHYEMGDVTAGFAQSDRVFEHTFTSSHQHQAYLEPHASIVEVGQSGHTDVWINSKMPFQVRKQMAEGLDLDESEIRLNPAPIGGDFGGKGSFMDAHIAYHLSRATGRPVRMVMDYIEEFQGGNPRHPSRITYKTGVKNDGTILARQVTMHFNSGAYAAFKPSPLLTYGGLRAVGPYRVYNIQVDSYMVYSNLVPCGSLRAPGDPQTIFAAESQIDIIARELGHRPVRYAHAQPAPTWRYARIRAPLGGHAGRGDTEASLPSRRLLVSPNLPTDSQWAEASQWRNGI